ncbi:MAG: YbjQ family protein [Candidatus Micrarchaeota archaeon]
MSCWWMVNAGPGTLPEFNERGTGLISTTTFEVPGHRIAKSLGLVRGLTVRTRSLPATIAGGLRSLCGGRAGIFADLCESAREESFQLMVAHARKIGANAVVGVRYDTGPMVGAAEVLRSGCKAYELLKK